MLHEIIRFRHSITGKLILQLPRPALAKVDGNTVSYTKYTDATFQDYQELMKAVGSVEDEKDEADDVTPRIGFGVDD